MSEDELKNELREKVAGHETRFVLIAQSMEHQSEALSSVATKVDNMIEMIAKQNVLMERLHNLEENLRESFGRVHKKITVLEDNQNGQGCSALKVNAQADAGRDARIKKLENSLTWVVRIVIGSLITGLMTTLFIMART